MSEFNSQLTPKEEKSSLKFSHQLLLAFNCEKFPLKSKFICIHCSGISSNPLFCKLCRSSICLQCFGSILEEKVRCHCKEPIKSNFMERQNYGLKKTYYSVQDTSYPYEFKNISYSEALSCQHCNQYCLIPTEMVDSNSYRIEEKSYEKLRKSKEKIIKHKITFYHSFTLKYAKMINFNFTKGIALNFIQKLLCEAEGNFLRIIHIKALEFLKCMWNLEFAISFCKGIKFNKRRLKSLKIQNHYSNSSNYSTTENKFQSYLIIFNACFYCSNLEYLHIDNFNDEFYLNLIPRSFFNFLSPCFRLKEIEFSQLMFFKYMNFQSFQGLTSLKILKIQYCYFHFNCFESLYLNNFPKLEKLYLFINKLEYTKLKGFQIDTPDNNKNISINFPKYIVFKMNPDFFSLEYNLIQVLIQKKDIPIKYLEVNLCTISKKPPENYFLTFIKKIIIITDLKIQFLELNYIEFVEDFNYSDFSDFLSNSEYLQGLKLSILGKKPFYVKLILSGLKLNKSIKIIFLEYMNLSKNFRGLLNLIRLNTTITSLVIIDDDFTNLPAFIKALLKSKTLINLVFNDITFKSKSITELTKNNLSRYIGSIRGGKKRNDLDWANYLKEIHKNLLDYEYLIN